MYRQKETENDRKRQKETEKDRKRQKTTERNKKRQKEINKQRQNDIKKTDREKHRQSKQGFHRRTMRFTEKNCTAKRTPLPIELIRKLATKISARIPLHEKKIRLNYKNCQNKILRLFRCNQMPSTNRNA